MDMLNLFDKDFFKLFFGFLVILMASFTVFYLAQHSGIESGEASVSTGITTSINQ
jgi:hypothetical protein